MIPQGISFPVFLLSLIAKIARSNITQEAVFQWVLHTLQQPMTIYKQNTSKMETLRALVSFMPGNLCVCVCVCVLDAGDVGQLGIISTKSQTGIILGTRLASPRETYWDLVEAHFCHWRYSGGQRAHFTTRPYLILEHLCLSTAKHVHPS